MSLFRDVADVCINLADAMNAASPQINRQDIVIIASPVYGGRLPPTVAARFRELEGNALVEAGFTRMFSRKRESEYFMTC